MMLLVTEFLGNRLAPAPDYDSFEDRVTDAWVAGFLPVMKWRLVQGHTRHSVRT